MDTSDILAVMRSLPSPPPSSGRAYLTISNPDYNAGTYVLASMLRHVGANDPVHAWHWRDMPPAAYLRGLVELRHLDDIPGASPSMRIDALRSLLLLHCGLSQAFWLGSDVYPVADPTPCWGDATRWGAVWWREVPHGDRIVPANYGLPDHARHDTYQIQGDTILLDLSRPEVYRAVALTHWFNERPERFDRAGEAHGDQTQYRAAWALCGLRQHFYTLDRVDWTSWPLIYLHQGRDGRTPLFVHRVGAKWPTGGRRWNGPPVYHLGLPLEDVAWRYYREVAGG
jgi:hypothetical protein